MHHVGVANVADVSKIHAAPIYRVGVFSVGEFQPLLAWKVH
jgi:hypothetical protein